MSHVTFPKLAVAHVLIIYKLLKPNSHCCLSSLLTTTPCQPANPFAVVIITMSDNTSASETTTPDITLEHLPRRRLRTHSEAGRLLDRDGEKAQSFRDFLRFYTDHYLLLNFSVQAEEIGKCSQTKQEQD